MAKLIKVKSPEEVWLEDKERLRNFYPDLEGFNYDGKTPTAEGIYSILREVVNRRNNPQEQLLPKYPERVLYVLRDKLMTCWNDIRALNDYRGIQALFANQPLKNAAKCHYAFALNTNLEDEEIRSHLSVVDLRAVTLGQAIRDASQSDPSLN